MRSIHFALLLVASLALCAVAFKPNEIGHVGITEEALSELGFTAVARDAIANANVLTDIFEQLVTEAHFDDEHITEGSQRLLTKKEEIFKVFQRIAERLDNPSSSPSSSPSSDSTDFFDFGDFLEDTTADLIDRVSSLFGSSRNSDIAEAWVLLGQALHGLQDFYSHSNWVEMGNNFPNTNLGKSVVNTPQNKKPCPSDPAVLDLQGDGGQFITTSYFLFSPSDHCVLHEFYPGKCRHGWDFAGCPTGLNKDEPTRPNFDSAKSVAIESSKNYIQLVLDTINDLSSNRDEVRSLFLGGEEYDETTEPVISSQFLGDVDVNTQCEESTFTIENTGTDYRVIVLSDNFQSITLTNPNSLQVSATTSQNDRREYDLGNAPVTGVWTLSVCSSLSNNLEYQVDVQTTSPIYIQQFDFLRVLSPRTSFLFPLSPITEPIFGISQTYIAVIFGDIQDNTVDLDIVDITGQNVVANIPTVVVSSYSDSAKFSTESSGFLLPNRDPFRVRLTATATGGQNVIRYNSRVFTPQTVGVQFIGTASSFVFGPEMENRGEGLAFEFDITNYASLTASFDLRAALNSSSSAAFDLEIDVISSGSLKRETFMSPHERLEEAKRHDHASKPLVTMRSMRSMKERDVDTESSSVTISSLETVTIRVTVSLESKGNIDHGDLLTLSLTASNSDTSNADIVVGQYLDCPGSPVCSAAGICTAVDTCECAEGLAGKSCQADSSSYSPGISFSNVPDTITFSLPGRSPNSPSPNNSSIGSLLSASFFLVLFLSFLFF